MNFFKKYRFASSFIFAVIISGIYLFLANLYIQATVSAYEFGQLGAEIMMMIGLPIVFIISLIVIHRRLKPESITPEQEIKETQDKKDN